MQSPAAKGKAPRGPSAQTLLPSLHGAEIFPGPEAAHPAPSETGGRDEGGVNFQEEDDQPWEGKEIPSPRLFPFFCQNSRPSFPEEPEEGFPLQAAESGSLPGRFHIPPGGS